MCGLALKEADIYYWTVGSTYTQVAQLIKI